jgi:pyruvate dehydrogenase (quinone)
VSQTVGDFVARRLHEWGVERIYGYPGDGINGITAGLRRLGKIDFLQMRHEESAAFAACAHAKYGGGPVGVCLATSGPGAVHLLNGLYDAKLDHQPVMAIVGHQPRSVIGSSYMQEIDLVSLFKDVAHEYVHLAAHPAQVRHLIDRAIRIAIAERTVTCVIVPNDLQEEPADAASNPPHKHGFVHSGLGMAERHETPSRADLEQAAEVLNEGERVAILVGQGALGARTEVEDVAGTVQAGVAKALLGKAVLPDTLPYVTGAIGMLGTKPSWQMMQRCDTLLTIGSNMPYSEFLPEEGRARGIQIDIDPRMLGIRYPNEVNLPGDSGATLRALTPLLEPKPENGWREQIEAWVMDWWKIVEARAMNEADPINGQRVFWELSARLPDRVMITCDCGTATGWYARDIKLRDGMFGSTSGTLATMGSAIPYAIAAKFAHPDRPCVALIGDGAMQMDGVNELITVAKYWKQWSDPRVVVVILNNRDLSYVTWEQRAMVGDIRYEASQELPDVQYARWAELLGLDGVRVERADEMAGACAKALQAERPFVLEALVDTNVPPLPPHITAEQAAAMTRALLKGDPDRAAIIRQTLRDLVEDYVPHGR